MQRRKFGREFKVEAVRLIKERGVAVAQAAARSRRERERAAQVGEGVVGRSGAGLSGGWPDEARSTRDRSAAA